ncbi:MAG: VOC family protein [Geodermatophilaceae bacterium]|nr:VOC family protein [Geodermatophilaceae bacterium]
MATGFGVTIDCRDPGRLAEFWRKLLGYIADPPPEGNETWADYDREVGVSAAEAKRRGIVHRSRRDPAEAVFNRVTESKREKNRWHLDLAASATRPDLDTQAGIDAEVTRAVALGATVLRTSPHTDDLFTVLRDPEATKSS